MIKGGKIYKINKGIQWDQKSNIMNNWVSKCLEQKIIGKEMNKKEKNSG